MIRVKLGISKQLWYSSVLTWDSWAPFSSVFHWCLLATHELFTYHLIHDRNDMALHKNNAIKFSKYKTSHKHKQEPWDVAQHKPYLKVLYNMYVLLVMDNLMDSSNMATLSMEPRKQIITLQNNYYLTSYSVSCRHFTWIQKCCNW